MTISKTVPYSVVRSVFDERAQVWRDSVVLTQPNQRLAQEMADRLIWENSSRELTAYYVQPALS